jgi:hypothetical protein
MFIILRNLLVVVILAPLAVFAVSEEQFIRNVDAPAGGKLVVDVSFGSVDLASGPDGKVSVEAHREIDFGDEAKEKEFLANAPITLTQDGNVVTIRSRGQNAFHWSFHHQHMDAKYTIRVPKKFEADLKTDGGGITAKEIVGNMKAKTSGGRLIFAHLEGELNGHTSGGAIEIEDCNGPLVVETSGGHIHVTQGQGSLNAHTSGGAIEVRNFSGDSEVLTSGGRLVLEKVAGKIVGKTSGGSIAASIPRPVLGDVKLETSAGSIDIGVPSDAALTIDAKTSVGSVVTSLPIQATQANRQTLRGTLNGGGKSVQLETSAGSISISSSGEIATR